MNVLSEAEIEEILMEADTIATREAEKKDADTSYKGTWDSAYSDAYKNAIAQLAAQKAIEKTGNDTVFIRHIEEHLKNENITSHGDRVICKICNKTVDEIYRIEGKKYLDRIQRGIEEGRNEERERVLKAIENCRWHAVVSKDRVADAINDGKVIAFWKDMFEKKLKEQG